jgi:nitroreductase
MDILELIKNKRTIRKYKNEPIEQEAFNKIIEAGIWGPSLLAPGFQPWIFVYIQNKDLVKQISDIMLRKSKKMDILGSRILRLSANTIANAEVVIAVYNSSSLTKFAQRIKDMYIRYAKFAELAAISASIQNMLLTAESLGIGSNWLDTPLFCEKEIDRLLNINYKLVAILTFGYPAEKGKRSPRKLSSKSIKII